MHTENKINTQAASKQHNQLVSTLADLGAHLYFIEPGVSLPDMVFTANAGLVYGNKVVVSNFFYQERQGEEELFANWFQSLGFEVVRLSAARYFEGAGDALLAGDVLYEGYGFRSSQGLTELKDILGLSDVIGCELVNPHFYHLDTCFCPLDEHVALAYPEAFTKDSFQTMQGTIQIIEVDEEDANKFACNAVVLDRDIIIPAGTNRTQRKLSNLGYTCHPVELNEFIKAGGAAKCLTLRLDVNV